jgi:hypothetical protein
MRARVFLLFFASPLTIRWFLPSSIYIEVMTVWVKVSHSYAPGKHWVNGVFRHGASTADQAQRLITVWAKAQYQISQPLSRFLVFYDT